MNLATVSNRSVVLANLALSAVIFGGLMALIYAFQLDTTGSGTMPWLPHFNAACNATATVALVTGYLFIRREKRRAHAIAMVGATLASGAFLVGYLTHHTIHGDTRFGGEGWIRAVYFFILITHILLSAVALPLILNTLSFAALRRFTTHRRVARWTFPIWLYVSLTGVAVWFFLRVLEPGA
jgi:putative membrane protein